MSFTIFDTYKKINDHGQEYRTARDMFKILGYSEYRKFQTVIKKAQKACKNAWQEVSDHFAQVVDMVDIWSGAQRKIPNIYLSRYACYLIIQNADPTKDVVATWQSYFAIQTRIKEMSDQYKEDQKRLVVREEMKEHNKKLFSTAKQAWVRDYATFYDMGYAWLYGWLRKKDILEKKKLAPDANPLDYMSSEELGANLFRATQTEAKLKREWVAGEKTASKTHYDVAKKVRETIEQLGGTMPERLPVVDNIKQAKQRLDKLAYISDVPWFELHKPPVYMLPDSLDAISQIASIIKENWWNHTIKIGKNIYKVSESWHKKIKSIIQLYK